MHKLFPKKFKQMSLRRLANKRSAKQEEGMALIMALLIGLLVLAAGSSLLIRQLMSRKLGSSESYQQLAENAAVNGFNRILAKLNGGKKGEYLGYLYSVSNQASTSIPYAWSTFGTDSEPTLTPQICTNTDGILTTGKAGARWDPTKELPLSLPDSSATLINDQSNGASNQGDIQTFYELTGYDKTTRTFEVIGTVKRVGNGKDQILAKALLTRSLDVLKMASKTDDWAVIGGNHLQLGSTTISGSTGAAAATGGRVVINIENTNNFDEKDCFDQIELNSLNNLNYSRSTLTNNIWPLINTAMPDASKFKKGKVVDTTNNGVTRLWTLDDNNSGCAGSAVCTRPADDASRTETPSNVSKNNSTNTTVINPSGICQSKTADDDICHIYVERINLTNEKIVFELDNTMKAVVLHLEYPDNATDPRRQNGDGRIQLRNGSKLCVGQINPSGCDTDLAPEKLVITSSSGPKPNQCVNAGSKPYVLQIEGNSLPAALIHMPNGTVNLVGAPNPEMTGIIWASSICANNNGLKLTTSVGGKSVIERAQLFWDWLPEDAYGRTVLRGVRGEGYDLFRRI
ncbi:hypothetical protein [Synechococcus sp. MIT S9503]|uniref:hypothetical protein n=1 Tax=Synechococcus sp. MIT S9503 TaxID=3082547 RepID=UPI0039A60283